MRRDLTLKHEFVEHVPNELKDGTIYVSIAFATVVHKCCCGCGIEVVTPLSPTDWQLVFDGESISLYPSIGNWNLACQSHYWIERNRVKWARRWSRREIEAGRARDRLAKERYFNETGEARASTEAPGEEKSGKAPWRRLTKWWAGR